MSKCYYCGATTDTTTSILRSIDVKTKELRSYTIFRGILLGLIALGVLAVVGGFLLIPGLAVLFFLLGLIATGTLTWLTFYRIRDVGSMHLPVIPALRYQLDELRDQLAQQQQAS